MSFAEERGTNVLGFAWVFSSCRFTKPSGTGRSEEETLIDVFSKALIHLITFDYHATN